MRATRATTAPEHAPSPKGERPNSPISKRCHKRETATTIGKIALVISPTTLGHSMYRQIGILHQTVRECGRSLAEFDAYAVLLQLPAMADAEEYQVLEAIGVLAREAVLLRSRRRYWTLMPGGLKSVVPNPSPYRAVMHLVDVLNDALNQVIANEDSRLFGLTPGEWSGIVTAYRGVVAAQHLAVPNGDVLNGLWPDLQHAAYGRALADATSARAAALAAAHASLAQPGQNGLKLQAEAEKSRFIAALDPAIYLAGTVAECDQVQELLRVGYSPLEQF